MNDTKLTISNDLASTEVGEYVTGNLIGVAPGQAPPRVEVPDWTSPRKWGESYPPDVPAVVTRTFARRRIVIDGVTLALWQRIA